MSNTLRNSLTIRINKIVEKFVNIDLPENITIKSFIRLILDKNNTEFLLNRPDLLVNMLDIIENIEEFKADNRKEFRVFCTWTECGIMRVKANSLDEAIQLAANMPLPNESCYVDGSFRVDSDSTLQFHDEQELLDKDDLD